MRGIGSAISRLPLARAFIAGAAILAGAFAPAAQAQDTPNSGDEAAMAIPRAPSIHGGPVSLPEPLAPSEAARIRRIFTLQAHGRMAEAARETGLLTSTILLGHIQADRYLGRFHRSTADELTAWLARYSDEPDAPAIHDLLCRRVPKGTPIPPLPETASLPPAVQQTTVPEDDDPRARAISRNPLLDRTVAERAQQGNASSALRLIARTKGMKPAYAALLRAEVAQILFTRNEDAKALEVASNAVRHTPADDQVALAGYIAGLAAWRLDRAELALTYFEGAARAPYAPAAIRAAGAFWAARAHLHTGHPSGFAPWMRRAAEEPRTLYGLIARRMLGVGGGFTWSRQTLSGADLEAVAGTPQGLRAFALLQVGQPDRAEAELRMLWPTAKDDPSLRNAVLLVAREAGFTDLTAQIATLVQAADGKPRDFDRFPVPKLRPRNGFQVDPALVYGLTRVESNFDPGAVSPVGARGLMQIMPVTAGYIAGDPSLASSSARLHDPGLNLELGQRYVSYLARQDHIDGDLIRVLASYNAGPGSFARWGDDIRDGGDPLMFIEAIPLAETRAFVQHALTYTWIYAARLHLPSPSLDAMAAGAFPRFTPLEETETIADAAPRVH
ncbi:MAG: lytic transglycosylase domain-containing protein [Alphaproteobacteria bacterium]|nr:lytic transglycosylase domain-containing protein [Alphaproteobacteria bacterium]